MRVIDRRVKALEEATNPVSTVHVIELPLGSSEEKETAKYLEAGNTIYPADLTVFLVRHSKQDGSTGDNYLSNQ